MIMKSFSWVAFSTLVFALTESPAPAFGQLHGQLPLGKRSGVSYTLAEERNGLRCELTIYHPVQEAGFTTDDLQTWVLTPNGGTLRQVKRFTGLPGVANAGDRNDRFEGEFEACAVTNVTALVIAVQGKLLFFDAHGQPAKPGFGAGNGPLLVIPPANGPKRDFADGDYLLNLEWWHAKQTVKIRVKGNQAETLESSDPKLAGMRGQFSSEGEHDFFIFFQTLGGEGASQHWALQPDGSYAIKEVPDRGEKERAIAFPGPNL